MSIIIQNSISPVKQYVAMQGATDEKCPELNIAVMVKGHEENNTSK